ncbi:MAG: NOL1/NOP2/sun family putative RNA methylase [Lachnospiraceae bacterium]|nr:NOL1/NOP2/sun family putative RNA methylase [Lachnospiraceae bacterium]
MQLPEQFMEKMKELLTEEFPAFLRSYDEERMYGLRVNTSKISCEEFEKIAPFAIRKIPWIRNGYYYDGNNVSPAKHPYYHAGLYYLQEPSAMTPADRLDIREYDAVLDLCAAPGGKATELGVKLGGKGVLVANDISSSRAKALLKNIELFGIVNPFVVNETPARLAEYFPEFFDRILLDAPCSGEGMFRKEPSVIKSYVSNGVDYYAKLQREILVPAVHMLKPGGKMLYSTCTFSPEEDERSIDYIIDRFPELKLIDIEGYEGFDTGRPEWGSGNPNLKKCVRIWPHRMNGEGHFLALLQKDGVCDSGRGLDGSIRRTDKNMLKSLAYFFEFAENLEWDIDESRLELQGERLFYMPEKTAGLKGMRFLRNGLYMGDCLKKRFEPSQALAMAIRRGEYKECITLPGDDARVLKYLKGETLSLTSGEANGKGWRLFCVDGFPLGWGKLAGGMLKNKYHSGWRVL